LFEGVWIKSGAGTCRAAEIKNARKPEEDLTQSVMQDLKKGFNEPLRRGGRRKQRTQTILEDLGEQTVRGISDWERIMR
jgi:hypothetical protein